jgi:uncharacterized delta-60 repeat protein
MSMDAGDGPGAPEQPDHLSPGFLVGGGRYTLQRQIGRGGMGVVWLAQDERLNEPVALKFLSSVVRNDAVELARLRQETQKSRKLTHANIIRIYDLYEAPGEPAFISMEYVNGLDLWEWMTQQPNGVLAWADLKPLVQQLCEALAYAHGERVIHRDLKPTNLMLAENKRLKLADFGLAAVALQVDPASVERRFGGGTLTHMSPQQLEGEVAAVTDDIYSLGATLYDLLCGQPPFYEGDIRAQLLHKAAPPLQERLATRKVSNDIPSEVAAVIMACLSKDPSKRPQSASAVAEWIGLADKPPTQIPALASTVFSASEASPPEETPPQRGGWLWLALVGGVVCVGLVVWLHRPSPPPPASPPTAAPSNFDVATSNAVLAASVAATPSNANDIATQPAVPVRVVTAANNRDATASNAAVPISVVAANKSYRLAVLALHPLAFWRLDEIVDSSALDIVNANNGDYHNVILGQPGHYSTGAIKSESGNRAARFGLPGGAPSFVSFPSIDLSVPKGGNGEFAVAAWVQASASNKEGAGIICKGSGDGDEQFCLDCGGIDNAFRFYMRDASRNSGWTRSSVRPDNQWHFLVGVCDQAHDRIYLYVDGTNAAQSTTAMGTGIHASKRPITIGARSSGARTYYDNQFIGAISDVAIFTNALNAAQVLKLYNAAQKAPVLSSSPATPAPPSFVSTSQAVLDRTFDAGRGPDGEINDMQQQPDGAILVAGFFNSFDGAARHGLVRLRADGKLDYQTVDVNGTVDAMAVQPDGQILIAGDFSSVNGFPRPRIARLEPNLALDPMFYAGAGPDGEVCGVVLANNGIFLAGAFERIGDASLSRVARLAASGRIDPTFQIGPGANNRVLVAVAEQGGKVLIGGTFRRYHGVIRTYLSEILPSGEIGRFRGEVSGPVHAIVNQRDGKILIAGEFTAVHSVPFKGIARLNEDGTLDASFKPGAGPDRMIETMALQSDGKIVIGGDFSVINGAPRSHLARLNPDGSVDTAFFPKLMGEEVRKVLVQRDGKILVAGQFNSVEGVSRANLARLNP